MRPRGRENLRAGVRLPDAPAAYDQQDQARLRTLLEAALDRVQFQPDPPRIDSVDLTYDGDVLSLKAVGGKAIGSALFEIADNSAFTSPAISTVADLTIGVASTESTSSLSGVDLGKQWYGRVTPYTDPSGEGWAGVPVQDAEFVPLPTPTVPPTVAVTALNVVSIGHCGMSDPLTNRVTVEFYNTGSGGPYTWECIRYEDGASVTVVDTGLALTTLTVDDEIDAEYDPSAIATTPLQVAYRVTVSDGSGVVASTWSPQINQPRSDCP